MRPDEKTFDAHIKAGSFLAGAARVKWCLISIDWPIAYISITAKEGRKYCLRFDCNNYAASLPTARPWDIENNGPLPLDKWPKGTGRVTAVFNHGWKGGTALYLPCDRVAIEGHPNWVSQYPSMTWNPEKGIVQYLEIVYELLNSRDYLPAI